MRVCYKRETRNKTTKTSVHKETSPPQWQVIEKDSFFVPLGQITPRTMPGEEGSFSKKSLPLEGKVAFAKQMTDEV